MAEDTPMLGKRSAAVAAAASIAVLINTVLACAKDANAPLKKYMASLTGHDWTTQGIAVVLVFVVLGLVFLKIGPAEKARSGAMVAWVAGAVVLAGVALAGWYMIF